jgi:NAD(P)-dependent dehydrogenase (short-subunit alcohol dehydrogenase family)
MYTGRALCFRFASEGCHVAVADVDYVNAKLVADELQRYDVKSKAYKVS